MPSSTDYYGFKKPAPEDFYDVADQNGNADIVDAALHGLETGKAALGEDGKLPAALLPQLDFVPKTEKGAAGGVAQLDGTGRVPAGQLPEMNYEGPLKNAGVKAGIADGDGVVVTDSADGEKSKRVLWSTVKTALGALFRPGTWVPAWGDVTGKPSTFPPASHSHTAAQVGAMCTPVLLNASTNLNSITTPGFYYCPANATAVTFSNCPTTNAFYMEVGRHADTYQRIVEYMTGGAKIYFRNYYQSWGAWAREYSTNDKPTAADVGAAAAIHTHAASQVTAGTFPATDIKAATGTDYTTSRIRNIRASTTDLMAGSSALSNGEIYLVYE